MTIPWRKELLVVGLIGGLLAGCASQQTAGDKTAAAVSPEPAAETAKRKAAAASPVKRSSGPIAATRAIPPGSPFAKVKVGMSEGRVYDMIGHPNEVKTYLTGKSWIPFYFGPDTHRKEALYKGMGRIVFTPSSTFGTGVYRVHEVIYDPNEDGYAD